MPTKTHRSARECHGAFRDGECLRCGAPESESGLEALAKAVVSAQHPAAFRDAVKALKEYLTMQPS
jgi:hypothetical protein